MLQMEISNLPSKDKKHVKRWLSQMVVVLQEARRNEGYSQEELAENLEVSVNTIKYIEQGRRLPSLPLLLRLVKELNLEINIS